jgi:starch phosphorylase
MNRTSIVKAALAYLDPESWSRKCILNVARMGKFSSDRTISEYAREIWQVKPVAAKYSRPFSDNESANDER